PPAPSIPSACSTASRSAPRLAEERSCRRSQSASMVAARLSVVIATSLLSVKRPDHASGAEAMSTRCGVGRTQDTFTFERGGQPGAEQRREFRLMLVIRHETVDQRTARGRWVKV